jgi:hypothetical protein
MKRPLIAICSLLAVGPAAWAQARAPETAPPPPPPPPPPVYPAATVVTPAAPVYVYDQKPVGGRPYLIAPEQAQSIIDRFKEHYKKLGTPRMVIYVNRDLVDENSGMKLSAHKQVVETSRSFDTPAPAPAPGAPAVKPDVVHQTERVVSTNIYRIPEPKETPLADRQTVRDLERLFGRPLRMAGVQLADQRVASQLLSSRSLEGLRVDSEQAARDRQALSQVADVVLEILVSSKDTPVAELSGDRIYSAPDIQATAIRLADSRILGQATAADLIGQGPNAGQALRTFGIREIAEATALSLMEDMMLQ